MRANKVCQFGGVVAPVAFVPFTEEVKVVVVRQAASGGGGQAVQKQLLL